jgi:hypothetical protein
MNRDERLDDPEESLRLALENAQSQIWTATPAIVQAVNLAAQTLSVQPAIQGTLSNPDGTTQTVNLPLLVDVPIVWPRAGGFALTFPIAVGDEVLVVFGARCIDSWWQSGSVGAPAEARMHDLSDGFAILAPTSQPKKFANVSSTNVQLRDTAGTTYVEITPGGKARVVGASAIDIEAPTINLNGSSAVNVTAPTIALNGQVTQASGSFSIGGIVFGTHKHTGVQSGPSNTGGPTN